jgi:hypothetical protein
MNHKYLKCIQLIQLTVLVSVLRDKRLKNWRTNTHIALSSHACNNPMSPYVKSRVYWWGGGRGWWEWVVSIHVNISPIDSARHFAETAHEKYFT